MAIYRRPENDHDFMIVHRAFDAAIKGLMAAHASKRERVERLFAMYEKMRTPLEVDSGKSGTSDKKQAKL